jgi:pimeloyl-ACP methyl ester carboxylesterase
MARDVLDQVQGRFALVGLSMGGIVALEIWRQASERITHLALLDTTCYADRRRELRLEQIARVERGELRQVTSATKPLYLSARNSNNRHIQELVLEMGMALGPEVFVRQSVALRDRGDSSNILSNIMCPTLILCGLEDNLCPLDIHLEMARFVAHGDLVALTDCGHLSALERPEAVTASLDMLLRRPP